MRYLYQQLLAFWLIIILTIVLIGLSFTNINRRTLVAQNYNQIRDYIDSVERNLSHPEENLPDTFSSPYNALTREEHLRFYLYNAEVILANQGIKFVLLDNNKSVIYSSTEFKILDSLLNNEEWEIIRTGRSLEKTIKYDLRGEPSQTSYILSGRFDQDQFYGVLIAAKSARDLENSQKLITDNLLKGFVISLLFGGAISFALATRQVKKINDLKRAVNQITNRNFEITVEEEKGKDEFNELAHDFNKMAVALQDNEKEIIRQEELRKQFMANTSHEMRTPLTTIKGLLEGLKYNAIPETQKDKAIVLMQNETDRLIRLVKQNLDYETIRSHQITLTMCSFDGTDVLRNILTQFQETADAVNDRLSLLNEQPVEVYADRDRFIQIMVNVIQNAIQFTDNGEIKVDLRETDSTVLISVEDTGIGMTEEEQKNIWDRYYKADPSRKNTKLGESGLGLSIVKELIQLHGGSIDVSSQKEVGTLFVIRLPKKTLEKDKQ